MGPRLRGGDTGGSGGDVTLFAIYDHEGQRVPQAVPERFSWAAALLPPVFLLRHGLWLETFLWAGGVVMLRVGAVVIGGAAAFWLYVLGAIAIGFAAPSLRRRALRSRGWTARGHCVAPSADMAQMEVLR